MVQTSEVIVECPQCGQPVQQRSTSSNVEQIDCYACGYCRQIDLDQTTIPPKCQITQQLGFGGYILEYVNGVVEKGSFATNQSKAYFEHLVDQLSDQVIHASYTELLSGTIKQTILKNSKL